MQTLTQVNPNLQVLFKTDGKDIKKKNYTYRQHFFLWNIKVQVVSECWFIYNLPQQKRAQIFWENKIKRIKDVRYHRKWGETESSISGL